MSIRWRLCALPSRQDTGPMPSLLTEVMWLGEPIRTFRDLIPQEPRALLVGLNPSPVSLDKGHYHQGRLGRRMWRRLERVGILPPPPPGCFHDELLADLGLGITDLVKRPSARAAALTPADFAYGRERLRALLDRIHPPLTCFIYKQAAEQATGTRLPSGSALLLTRLCGSQVFVFPSPYADEATACRHLSALKALVGTALRRSCRSSQAKESHV
jgi:TDG/mug DNA glycosylase family protein